MFNYGLTEEHTVKCIAVSGRIDALSAPDIQRLFDGLVLSGEQVLLVDMTSVNYVSSAGLRVFLSIQKQLKKVGGEIIFFGMNAQVFEIYKMSGLTTVFRIAARKDEAQHFIEKSQIGHTTTSMDLEGAQVEYLEGPKEKGSFFAIGSSSKTAASTYTEEDVVSVKASGIQFGCGFATLGDKYDEYKNLFGESMVVKGSFFFYPAVKHSSVDYLIDARRDPGTEYKFLHGFGFNGPYRYIIGFEGREHPLELTALVKGFFSISPASVIGIVIVAESRGLWGMHMKKVPLAEQRPAHGESVFDGNNFPEWIDFPVEPTYVNHVVVATGIAIRDRESVSPEVRSLVAESNNYHIHGAIFEKTPLSKNIRGFDEELQRIFNELEAQKIQHILGRSKFSVGMAAITELDL
jgi:anti-anti-sigma factor